MLSVSSAYTIKALRRSKFVVLQIPPHYGGSVRYSGGPFLEKLPFLRTEIAKISHKLLMVAQFLRVAQLSINIVFCLLSPESLRRYLDQRKSKQHSQNLCPSRFI